VQCQALTGTCLAPQEAGSQDTLYCEEYSSAERRLMAVPHLSPVFPALLIETAATHDFYRPYT